MINKDEILKIVEKNDGIFVDFPFYLQNNIDNGDILPNVQVFPEQDFLNVVNEKLDLDIDDLYDLQDYEDDVIYDILVEFVNNLNMNFVPFVYSSNMLR